MDEHNKNRDEQIQKPPEHGDESHDHIDSRRDEEFAADFAADDFERTDRDYSGEQSVSIYGWIAIALSALSFFMMPIILGAAGIIVGFVSRNRGADTLGNIAIAAGAISILISIFILPFI